MNQFDEILAQARAAIADMDAIRAEVENDAKDMVVEHEETTTNDADADSFEKAARRGDYGREWQVLQRRIDLGETSRTAIFSGEDMSVEAEKLRKVLSQKAELIVEMQNEDDDTSDDAKATGKMFAEVRQEQEEILQMLKELREIPPPTW